MTQGNVFVGVDAGTTGATVALFDEDGREIAAADREYGCVYPHPGWVEQDMGEVWHGICAASREARAKADIPDAAIRSIGLSSQRGSFVLLDRAERPLGRAVLWNDSRAKEIEAVIAERIAPERFRAITGMPLSGSWSIAKLVWLARHEPERMAAARWICNGQEYFLRRMGADGFETDPASLTLNGMLDVRRLDWSDEVCRAAGVDSSLLPPVGTPGAMVGRLSPTAAEEMGLPSGTLICRGAGDQQCAAVGAGVIRQGLAEVTVGTSAMMVAHLDHPDLVVGSAPYIGGHAIAGKWDLEGGAFSIGSCLRWWRDNFCARECQEADRQGISPYELILAEAAKAPAGSKGTVFHPFFAGQVTPYYDTAARGGFYGLGLHQDRACMLRSLLEGCACEIGLMVEAFDRDLAGGLRELRLTGGCTRSDLFVQIQADILRRPIATLANGECTVLGAAILGAVGAGHFAGIDEAVASMVRVDRVVEPEASTEAVYGELFGVFRHAYEAAAESGLYARMYRFQSRFF